MQISQREGEKQQFLGGVVLTQVPESHNLHFSPAFSPRRGKAAFSWLLSLTLGLLWTRFRWGDRIFLGKPGFAWKYVRKKTRHRETVGKRKNKHKRQHCSKDCSQKADRSEREFPGTGLRSGNPPTVAPGGGRLTAGGGAAPPTGDPPHPMGRPPRRPPARGPGCRPWSVEAPGGSTARKHPIT